MNAKATPEKALLLLRESGTMKENMEFNSKNGETEKLQYFRCMGYLEVSELPMSQHSVAQQKYGKQTRGLKGINK